MAFSNAATQQREQEAKALKRFLTYCLLGSLGLHGAALLLNVNQEKSLDQPEEISIIVTQSIEPDVEPEPDSTVLPEESTLQDVPEPPTAETPVEPSSAALLEEPIAPPPPSTLVAPLPEPAVSDEPVETTPTEDVLTAPANQSESSSPTVTQPNRRSVQDLLQNLRQNRQPTRTTTTENSGSSPANATSNEETNNNTTATGPSSPGVPQSESGETGSDGGAASCRNCPQVDYPESALEAGAEGRVRVIAETDEQGRVVGVTLIESSGNPDLDQAVLEQVRQEYEFNGAGAGASIPIEVDMTLEGSDYNQEARERGERTEVQLPTEAAEEPSETPQTAAEPIEPAAPADLLQSQPDPVLTPLPEVNSAPARTEASPVPSEPELTPPEAEVQPEANDVPEIIEPEPLLESLDDSIAPEPPIAPDLAPEPEEPLPEELLFEPEILPTDTGLESDQPASESESELQPVPFP